MAPNLKQGDIAWLVIFTGVLLYELIAEDLLSYAAERYYTKRPVLTRVVIGAIAGHLAGVIPPRLDVFHHSNILHHRVVKRFPLTKANRRSNRTARSA